jgi:hypothetical protein
MGEFLLVVLLGGVAFALLLVKLKGRPSTQMVPDLSGRETRSTDAINMAHIRVAGVGGLGLIAVAAIIALDIPSIGQSVAMGFVFGACFAAFLILKRRRAGPMPSSGQSAGANTTLSIDAADTSHPGTERRGHHERRTSNRQTTHSASSSTALTVTLRPPMRFSA